MKNKNYLVGIFFLILLLVSAVYFLTADISGLSSVVNHIFADPVNSPSYIEEYIKKNMPFSDKFSETYIQLEMIGGLRKHNGIYISEDSLILDLEPTDNGELFASNTAAAAFLAKSGDVPTYLMLIPTACAIYQEKLPSHASIYGQRGLIDQCYKELSGVVSTVDVYPSLFAARDGYIYYRTDDSLTSLGCFKAYQSLVKRLGFVPRSIEQFEIVRMSYDYYGKLYDIWGYGGVKPDIVTVYKENSDRIYTVNHWERYEQRTYHSLFPSSLSGRNVILGGISAKVDIVAENAASDSSIIVFGDSASFDMVTFLALHYKQVTFVDLSLLTQSEIADIDISDFDQVLLAYSVSTFLNTDIPARINFLQLDAKAE